MAAVQLFFAAGDELLKIPFTLNVLTETEVPENSCAWQARQ
uniref:TOR1B protein n=1 Tax=Homo sapiens TaxID=9606 RepID=Q9BR69_HUMAN|nr:TOR1B protein [Homo sapiens]